MITRARPGDQPNLSKCDRDPPGACESKGVKKLWLVGGLVTFLVVAAIAGVMTSYQSDKPEPGFVAANVSVAGRNVSHLSEQQLANSLSSIKAEYESANMEIGSSDQRFDLWSTEIGLTVDTDATTESVMKIGREGNYFTKVGNWLDGLRNERKAPLTVSWNQSELVALVSDRDPGPRTEAIEPSLSFDDQGKVSYENGKNGDGLDARDVAKRLPSAVNDGLPISVEVDAGTLPPLFEPEDLEKVYDQYRTNYKPIMLISGTKNVPLEFDTLKTWLRSDVSNGKLRLTADEAAITQNVPGLLPDSGLPVTEASWKVSGTTPQFDYGTAGSTCCNDQAPRSLRTALFPANGVQPESVDLGLRPLEPKAIDYDPNSLGIKEKVGSFTTNYPAGQPRVVNIHRISDLTQGATIAPGATFSLNGYVGPRTIEKGFVADGVIYEGKFEKDVGGGISQYSTTLFNAAFFAGLEWSEYQAHSIYISRYPYGREATISFPAPDQKIKNVTPYSILIWPTYTRTSVTVDLYSTKYVDAAQTGQREQKVNECTRVITERTRRYLDGRTDVDTVSALYQPKEGVLCR